MTEHTRALLHWIWVYLLSGLVVTASVIVVEIVEEESGRRSTCARLSPRQLALLVFIWPWVIWLGLKRIFRELSS